MLPPEIEEMLYLNMLSLANFSQPTILPPEIGKLSLINRLNTRDISRYSQ